MFNSKTRKFDDSTGAFTTGLTMLSQTMPEFGVTGLYVATVAASVEQLKKCCGCLGGYMKSQGGSPAGTRLHGALLEGTFINPNLCGALDKSFVFEPSAKVFDSIEDGGAIKLVNVIPDFGQSSVELTWYLTKKGIVVGAGHTNATCQQFADAVKAGLKYCIHFTNGPTGGSYKPFDGGGAIEAVLKFDEVYAELIADGFHVNPAYIRDIIKRKGIAKIIGITDCMFVAGSSERQVEIGASRGEVSDDGKYIRLFGKTNALFGSTLTMSTAFENVLNWLTSDMQGVWNRRHEPMDFNEALAAVSKMYSTTPCEVTGLAKSGFGRLTDGEKADVCVLDISGSAGNYKVEVESTIINGSVVYSKN
jgi:N-acetylglucosamine-6-phosphate deacetylase